MELDLVPVSEKIQSKLRYIRNPKDAKITICVTILSTFLFFSVNRLTKNVIEACDLFFKLKLPPKKVTQAIIKILASFAQKIGSFKKYRKITLQNNTNVIAAIKIIVVTFSTDPIRLLTFLMINPLVDHLLLEVESLKDIFSSINDKNIMLYFATFIKFVLSFT